MLAGGMTIAAPSMVPDAHAANATLYVSAENSTYNNTFGGPQIIEVVITNPEISRTDQTYGDPDVEVNGKKVQMAQGSDGSWYAYIADEANVLKAHNSANGITFGNFCADSTSTADLGVTLTGTDGYYLSDEDCSVTNGAVINGDLTEAVYAADAEFLTILASNSVTTSAGFIDGAIAISTTQDVAEDSTAVATFTDANDDGVIDCTFGGTCEIGPLADGIVLDNTDAIVITQTLNDTDKASTAFNALNSAATLNDIDAGNGGGTTLGGVGVTTDDEWPFVQLYNFNPTGQVEVVYKKAGSNEHVTLNFDTTSDLAIVDVDRTNVPQNASIQLGIGDPQLNIDPTDEDWWTWDTLNGQAVGTGAAFYRGAAGEVVISDLMFEDNGKLLITPNNVLTVQTNDDMSTFGSGDLGLYETGANTSYFTTYDDNDKSTIIVLNNAPRGTAGTIDYNDSPQSFVATHTFATLDLVESSVGDEWNSGEALTVILTDNDLNKNSRADEDLDLNNADVTLVPSLKIGTPLSLSTNVELDNVNIDATTGIDSFSSIARGDPSNAGTNITVDTGITIVDLHDFVDETNTLFEYLNYDVRGLIISGNDITDIKITSVDDADDNTDNAEELTAGLTATSNQGLLALDFIDPITVTFTDADDPIDGLAVGDQAEIVEQTGGDIATLSNGEVTLVQNGNIAIGTVAGGATLDTVTTANANFVAGDVTVYQGSGNVLVTFEIAQASIHAGTSQPFVVDFFSFGDRVNNAIYRMELEESGDNTSEFIGSVEYVMINQLNNIAATYTGLTTISNDIVMIVHEDLTDEDGPRVNYLDLGADGVSTQIADQQDAPSHSGVVDLDMDNYKVADTVTVTLTDMDLNVDSGLIDIYVTLANDRIDAAGSTNHLLDITFDDVQWEDRAASNAAGFTPAGVAAVTCADNALNDTGFTLVETDTASGVFTGTFQIPSTYCNTSDASVTVTGTDIEVNYNDHRDSSGETIEVGDGAGVRANTGSISLDRTVYPVPWGLAANFADITSGKTPAGNSIFPNHATQIAGVINLAGEQISASGDLTVHIRVNDADLDVSAIGEDTMNTDTANNVGPIKVTISRGSDDMTLAYAGGSTVSTDRGIVASSDASFFARTLGPLTEVAGDTGIFELDLAIKYTDGPESNLGPTTTVFGTLDGGGTAVGDRFKSGVTADTTAATNTANNNFCILQGDILTVEYTDATDASGNLNTVTDSATFDLRNGTLQSDKSVYIIGSDMILTIIEPDWDLDNDGAQSYDLDIVEWDSAAQTTTLSTAGFDPEPGAFRETGDSTGIFQVVIEIPSTLDSTNLERGEQIDLEYTDWGPSGANYVGEEDEDINVTVYTSNFGATVELDQKVYTWTDKVYITIVAPDHNFDSSLGDSIGETTDDPIKVSTRSFSVKQ
jgi:hypothetical protein